MEDSKKLEDKEQLGGQKNQNQEQSKYRHHFQVKYIPKGLFQLFNKTEEYIYEKKFSCELPKNIIPPKSFHYPFSLENFCQSDLLTMDFDLKKNREILTDPKINTFIHQDFINNSLELIFPNLTTISKKRTDEEQNFKKKIIEIIESNDEVNQDNNPALSEIPDFLRRQTYLRPSTVVNNEKKTKNKEKAKPEKKGKSDLVKIIDQSFNDIDKIKIGMKHPDPKHKGVTAKNIYEITPMDDMPNIQFIEYLFPSEPSEVPNLNEKYLKPNHFLIKTNKMDKTENSTVEGTCSLYINNKLKTQEDHTQIDRPEYYTYEKEFIPSKMNQNDLFNRYFLILDKNQKKLKIAPLSDKFSFRRYKKMAEDNNDNNNKNEENEANNANNNTILTKKRKRDIIVKPQSMSKEELNKKKEWLKARGYTTGLTERNIEEVNHDDILEIEQEREKERLEEELKNKELNDNDYNEDDFLDEEEGNEDFENDFDESGGENDNNNNEENSNKDENEEEQNSNEDNNNENENENDNENDNEEKENEESMKDNEDNKNKDDDDDEDKDENNNNEHDEHDHEHNKKDEDENEEDKIFDSNEYHK